ncbi:MAG TPA: hypothetical protein VFT74_14200 [Isosphaeraceae bacterium]|nr:hypothetical protein [Isosphaeraceae bacterium]
MRRHLAIVTLMGLFGLAMMASDARACHKNKNCGNPAPVCYQPCPPPPPPVCQPCPPPRPKKTCGTCGAHHGFLGGMKCHRKAKMACAPAPCPPAPCAPVYYGAPVVYSAPQTYAAPQGAYAAPQGMPGVPAKAAPQS